jgi:hypothetical protein
MTIQYTHTDLVIATAYYPILAEYVETYRSSSPAERAQWRVTYGDLVAQAKKRYPDVPEIQNATNINAGRRLGVIRQIANGDCPDMSCLILNKSIKETGDAYQGEFDPVAERSKLLLNHGDATFDFVQFGQEFQQRVESIRVTLAEIPLKKARNASAKQRKPKVSEDLARQAVHQHYQIHRAAIPASIQSMKESIVQWIMQGTAVEESFNRAIDHLTQNPPQEVRQAKGTGKPK